MTRRDLDPLLQPMLTAADDAHGFHKPWDPSTLGWLTLLVGPFGCGLLMWRNQSRLGLRGGAHFLGILAIVGVAVIATTVFLVPDAKPLPVVVRPPVVDAPANVPAPAVSGGAASTTEAPATAAPAAASPPTAASSPTAAPTAGAEAKVASSDAPSATAGGNAVGLRGGSGTPRYGGRASSPSSSGTRDTNRIVRFAGNAVALPLAYWLLREQRRRYRIAEQSDAPTGSLWLPGLLALVVNTVLALAIAGICVAIKHA